MSTLQSFILSWDGVAGAFLVHVLFHFTLPAFNSLTRLFFVLPLLYMLQERSWEGGTYT